MDIDHHIWSDIDRYSPICPKERMALASDRGDFVYWLPAFLGIMITVNWEYVFVTFHQLVFNNDYWLFDPTTDPIINILPDVFFMHCTIMIFVLVMAGSLLCFIFSHLLKHRSG